MQLAFGIAGAALGSAFGSPTIGWTAGVALGGLLGRKKGKQAPEVKDLRAQTSEYGTPIPIGYGTFRMAGFVMWAADKVPHKNKSGGKGGPKVTTTTFTQSYAIGLLETSFLRGDGSLVNRPIIGILRAWKDGQLQFGEGSEAEALPWTIYYGTEDQEPDPTIEAKEGVGNVSAHRGMAYIVFNDTSHTLPCNWTFEVQCDGEVLLEYLYHWAVDYDYPVNGSTYSYPYLLNGIEKTADGVVLHRYRSGEDYGAEMGTSDNGRVYYDRRVYDVKGQLVGTPDAQVYIDTPFAHARVFGSLNSGVAYVSGQFTIDCTAYDKSAFTVVNSYRWLYNGEVSFDPGLGNDASVYCPLATEDLAHTWQADVQQPVESAPLYWGGFVYAAGRGAGDDMILRRWEAPDGAVRIGNYDGSVSFNADEQRTGYPASNCIADPGDLVLGTDGYLYWLVGYYAGTTDGTRLFKLDADLNLIDSWWTGAGAVLPTAGEGSVTIFNGHIVGYRSAGIVDIGHPNFTMHRLNSAGTTTFVAECRVESYAPSPVHYIGGGLAAVRDGILNLGSGFTTLQAMVENVSQHMGYEDDEVDASELTDIVKGAYISQRMTGRSAIESWMDPYQFGAVERDFACAFPKYNGVIDAVIPVADLGAREVDAEPVDPIQITHVLDKDLPRSVEAIFLNPALDYQEGHQLDEDPTIKSDVRPVYSWAIVFDDAEAKQRVEMIRASAVVARDSFRIQVPRKYAYLEPTDNVAVGDYAIRLMSKEESGYTHIAFEGVATRSNVYVTAPVASPPVGFVPQVPPTTNRTEAALLDVPMDVDSDPQIGFKASIAGRMAGPWPGASLFKSIDGGVSYETILSTDDASSAGVATTALGDYSGGNVVDEMNSVTVRMNPGAGELSSTNDLGLLNGVNRALIGAPGRWEEIYYRDVELVAPRVYQLSGFLRGRRGTDRDDVLAAHVVGDQFFVLPLNNVDTEFDELGQERQYKAVTSGGLLANSSAVEFTNTGIALKPYAPVELGGGRNGAGDIAINWTRRTRIGGAWLDKIDVPLSEATELYRVYIADDNTYANIVRSQEVAVPTFTYTAALQTADFGSLQSTAYVAVLQIGSYGDGYYTTASI